MDSGQVVFILCRLVLGAVASFLAIMFLSRTRDLAWILVIIGIIMTYVETVYSVLSMVGIGGGNILSGNMPHIATTVLSCLPMLFFIGAFAVMVMRKYRSGS